MLCIAERIKLDSNMYPKSLHGLTSCQEFSLPFHLGVISYNKLFMVSNVPLNISIPPALAHFVLSLESPAVLKDVTVLQIPPYISEVLALCFHFKGHGFDLWFRK